MSKIMTYISLENSFVVMLLIASTFVGSVSVTAETPPAPVKVEQVKPLEQSSTTDILGTINSRNQAQLTAGVTGRLEWVAEPGTYLKKGDLVAQIELLPLQLRKAEQEAQHKRAKINLQYLERELTRQKELQKKNSVSQNQYDEAQSQFELAQADLEISELKLKQSIDQLARATVFAPFEGVVTERHRRTGFDVGRSDILVEMLDTTHLEVRVFVPIKYLSYTKPGTDVSLSSTYGDKDEFTFSATASTIIPTADPRSQTFEMRIDIPESAQEHWATGQLINVKIPIESKRSALTVHRDALILRQDGTYVVKIDDQNIVHRLKVEVGMGQGDRVIVEGELKPGDQVAIRGAERLKEGQEVEIQLAGS